jgi:hypothetical protein
LAAAVWLQQSVEHVGGAVLPVIVVVLALASKRRGQIERRGQEGMGLAAVLLEWKKKSERGPSGQALIACACSREGDRAATGICSVEPWKEEDRRG